MGGGKGGTTTQTVQIPPEVLARYNAVNARAEQVAQQPFMQYPGQFVAGLTPTQQAGIQATSQYSQAAQPYYQAGAGLTMAGAGSVGPLTQQQIQYYQNPFTQSVVDPTRAALQQEFGQQRSQQQAQAIRSGAFGGDRTGLERANLMRQQGLGMAQAIAPLYQRGYEQAVQTAAGQQGVVASDLQRKLAAGQQIAGLGTGAQQAALQGAQAQIAAGTVEQQTQQADLTARYQQFLQERGYPFQVAQFLANIAMGTGALSGSTTTTTQPTSFFSDERMKENITPVGETFDGQTIYRYNYKGEPGTQIGLIAQEVEGRHPDAVGLAGGMKTVDYGRATDEAASRGLGVASMGGAVTRPGEYAAGGSVVDADDMKAILAMQRQALGPFGQGGMYGGSAQETPFGKATGIVPPANLPVPKLVTAGSVPRPLPTGMQEAMAGMNQMIGLGEGLGKIYDVGERIAIGKPAVTKDGKEVEPAKSGAVGKGGKYDPDYGWFGSKKAGGGAIDPYRMDTEKDSEYFPSDVLEQGADKIRSLPKPGELPRQTGGLGDAISTISGGLGAAEKIGKFGKGAADFLGKAGTEGLGSAMSGLGSSIGEGVLGAGTAAAEGLGALGTGLGTVASGIGSTLGTVASAIPAFFAMFSDERLKHNVEPIGKTYDGQNIYRYDFGDGRTTMGLMAQEVAERKPEAVGRGPGGYLTLDYDMATGDAVPAGLAPRGGFQRGGAPEGAEALFEELESRYGLPSGYLARTYQLESSSGRDLVNPDSSARGHFQFTKGTLKDYPHDPYNLAESADAAARLAANNARVLREKVGVEAPTAPMLYLAHQQGGQGAANLLTGGNRPSGEIVGREAVSLNRMDPSASADEIAKTIMARFEGTVPQKAAPAEATGLAGISGPKTFERGFEKPKDQSMGDFLMSKQFLIPLATGLGAMASSPSRYLGSAILQGLGAGAQSYANLEAQQAGIGKTVEESRKIGAESAEITSRLYEKVWIPGKGFFVYDKSRPYVSPKQITDAQMNPIGAFSPSDVKSIPTAPGSPEPPTTPTTPLSPAATIAPSPTVTPAAPEAKPVEPAEWNPVVRVPENFTPEQQINIAMSEDLRRQEAAAGKSEVEKQRARSDSAYQQLFRLKEMEHQFKSLPESGVLTPGSFANERTEFAKRVNTAVAALGGAPVFDPNNLAAAETLGKDTFRLGTDLARSLGANEPGMIVQRAVEANPGMQNTKQAYARIAAGLYEAAKFQQDRAAFYDHYYSKFGHLSGADELFRRLNPPEQYARRAIISTVDPQDLKNLSDYAGKFKGQVPIEEIIRKVAPVFDAKYGTDAAAIILGK